MLGVDADAGSLAINVSQAAIGPPFEAPVAQVPVPITSERSRRTVVGADRPLSARISSSSIKSSGCGVSSDLGIRAGVTTTPSGSDRVALLGRKKRNNIFNEFNSTDIYKRIYIYI